MDHGVVDLTGPESATTGATPDGHGTTLLANESADAAVTLTPLGTWAMRKTLLGEGALVPTLT